MGRFVIKALTGPVKGQTFPLSHGLKIGRSQGDIIIKDKMISELHAEIQIYSNGQIMILDKDSKNKIIIKGKKIVKSVLEQGSKFQVGQTEFEVDFIQAPEEIMLQFMSKNIKNVKDKPLPLHALPKTIELVFLSGIQKGRRYQVSYGPRFFGSHSVDFPIFEKKSPKKAFILTSKNEKIIFKTEHPSNVRLNEKKLSQAEIKNGDKISIGDTTLKVTILQ